MVPDTKTERSLVISDSLAGLYVTDPVFILIHGVFVQDQEPLEI